MVANVLKRVKKEEKGFTLIELLAVIVILGVIAAIAIPLIGNIMSKSKDKSDFQTARQIYDAARLYITNEKNGAFKAATGATAGIKVDIATLQSSGYLESNISLPSSKASIFEGTVQFTLAGELFYVDIDTGSSTTHLHQYFRGTEVMKGEGTALPAAPPAP